MQIHVVDYIASLCPSAYQIPTMVQPDLNSIKTTLLQQNLILVEFLTDKRQDSLGVPFGQGLAV